MLDLEKIGNRISVRRKELKITQNELADKLYVTHQAVSKWENGKSIPSIEILYELTKLFEVSIDYLLDNTNINDDDYEKLLINYPREIVLANFLKQEDLSTKIDSIFYLLNRQERMKIINRIIHNHLEIEIHDLWPYLNKAERIYLLGIILSGKYDYNLKPIYTFLSLQERGIVHNSIKNGTYKHRLPHILI